MKILHVSSEAGWRGGERQIAFLIEALFQMGVSSHLVCKRNSELHSFCQKNRIPYFTTSFRNSFDIATANFIKKTVQREKYDLLHLHTPKAQTISVIAGIMGLKIPMVVTKRTAFKIKNNFFTYYKYNYSSIKKMIAISEKIADQLRKVIKEPGKIQTIYSSIDLDNYTSNSNNILRRDLLIQKHIKLIGIVAALSPEKDHLTFVAMAETLIETDKDIRFLIIGKGRLERHLKEEVAKRGLEETILFMGHRNDIYKILPDLDVLLLTSTEEGLGSVILDAFASKIPVVATEAGGIPELVIHKKTGLLAPIKNHKVLAEHVRMILDEPALRISLIENAYSFVQQFSKEETARKTLEVYREIVHSS